MPKKLLHRAVQRIAQLFDKETTSLGPLAKEENRKDSKRAKEYACCGPGEAFPMPNMKQPPA
eukprot:753986-Hanusia_phi.AAC.1